MSGRLPAFVLAGRRPLAIIIVTALALAGCSGSSAGAGSDAASSHARPEVPQRVQRDGLITQPMTMAEFDQFIAVETARWKPVIERAGLVGVKLD